MNTTATTASGPTGADFGLDPTGADPGALPTDWADQVRRLARERNAVILAHNYQLPQIQDVADHVGDSLALSRIAASAEQQEIIFCGVHFMAETAKILSPDKRVIIPNAEAGCSLADTIDAQELATWKAAHPGAVVVAYVNTSAEVKAASDICCTSSNAVEVVASLGPDQEILFLPDRHLGAHVRRVTGHPNLHVWPGQCHVHEGITGDMLRASMAADPDADVLVHPECACATTALSLVADGEVPADRVRIASTGGMLDDARRPGTRRVLVATETGMLHQLRRANPSTAFAAVSEQAVCPFMKMITPETLLRALRLGTDEVTVDPTIAAAARGAVERMIAIGTPLGRWRMNTPLAVPSTTTATTTATSATRPLTRPGSRGGSVAPRDHARGRRPSFVPAPPIRVAGALALPGGADRFATDELETDVLVIGSGVAGLTLAQSLTGSGLRVHLVTKTDLDDGSTRWAQGGIARATADPGDADDHLHDTLVAGAGLCDPVAVRQLVDDGPGAVEALAAHGARFDLGPDGRIALTREGGHSRPRIVHAGGDATGAEVQRALHAAVLRSSDRTHLDLTVQQHAVLVDLLRATDGRVIGAVIAEPTPTGPRVLRVLARATVLAHRRTRPGLREHHQPGRRHRGRRRPLRCAPGPRSPTWSSCSSTPRCCSAAAPTPSPRVNDS